MSYVIISLSSLSSSLTPICAVCVLLGMRPKRNSIFWTRWIHSSHEHTAGVGLPPRSLLKIQPVNILVGNGKKLMSSHPQLHSGGRGSATLQWMDSKPVKSISLVASAHCSVYLKNSGVGDEEPAHGRRKSYSWGSVLAGAVPHQGLLGARSWEMGHGGTVLQHPVNQQPVHHIKYPAVMYHLSTENE